MPAALMSASPWRDVCLLLPEVSLNAQESSPKRTSPSTLIPVQSARMESVPFRCD